MTMEIARSYAELMEAARAAEEKQNFDAAATLYQKAIREEPHEPLPYQRAMILLRKLHRYEDELALIKKGIATFIALQKKNSQKLIGKNAAVKKLSLSLALSLGVADKRGESNTHPEPVRGWMVRKETVEKKLGLTTAAPKVTAHRKKATTRKAAAKKTATRTKRKK